MEVDKVANMEVDMVANMKVDMVADMEVDMVANMKVDKVADTKLFLQKFFSRQIFGEHKLLKAKADPDLRVF